MKQRKGFTLVELLVVISIIGLLSTLAVVALNQARVRARDSKRLSDIKQIQTALELHYADQGVYPVEATAITLGEDATDVLTENGFEDDTAATGTTVYMKVPLNFAAPVTDGYDYVSADGTTYTISFELEASNNNLAVGAHTADPSGIN
jgi:prepilin-type N-terminal cleavage/methylation domain-containing protein